MAETDDIPPVEDYSLYERSHNRARKNDFITQVPGRLKPGETFETLEQTDPIQAGYRTMIAKKEIGLEEKLGENTATTLITDFWALKQTVLGRLSRNVAIDDLALAGAAVFDLRKRSDLKQLPYNVWSNVFELNMVVLDLNVYLTKED